MSKILFFEKAIFYLVLLLLPTQLGRHFWPEFSTVLGMRSDYLSPTLYLTDIFIFLLLLFFFGRKIYKKKRNFKFQISNFKLDFLQQHLKGNNLIFSFLLMVLIASILHAKNPLAGWYGLLKFLEFLFFGFYVSWQKIPLSKIALLFSFAIIFESFLAILQYFHQGSLGGVFYFFGERAFNPQTPGIANASLNGELILRPYGTLPHPNVLGGYLTIAMAMVMSNVKRALLFLALAVGTVALVLTMSRVAILLWLAILAFNSLKKLRENFKKRKVSAFLFLLPVLIIFTISFFFPLKTRLLDVNITDESIVERVALMKASVLMVKEHPIFGVGLNNFLPSLPVFQTQSADIFNLQPVHNIYALVGAETGLVGLLFFLWFISKTFKHLERNKQFQISNFKFQIFFVILVLGFFDHYFLTLQQGRMLFAFVLGLCWSKKLNA